MELSVCIIFDDVEGTGWIDRFSGTGPATEE